MPALDGTLALAQINRVAVLVRQHLHFDVARIDDRFLDVDFAVAKRPLGFALRRFQSGFQLLWRMHQAHAFPPPPAAAFSMTG